jgi:hypothetical protein
LTPDAGISQSCREQSRAKLVPEAALLRSLPDIDLIALIVRAIR